MAFLLQKDVPLVLTIIIAAWTWIFSEQIKKFDQLQVLEFQYGSGGHPEKILFRNISQSRSIKNLKVLVTCTQQPACFALDGEFAGTTEFMPPFGVKPEEVGSEGELLASYTFSLAIDSAIGLVLYLKNAGGNPANRLRFTIVNAQDFENLRLVEAGSMFAWAYRNEWPTIFLLLLVSTIVIFFLLIISSGKAKDSEVKRPARGLSPIARILKKGYLVPKRRK